MNQISFTYQLIGLLLFLLQIRFIIKEVSLTLKTLIATCIVTAVTLTRAGGTTTRSVQNTRVGSACGTVTTGSHSCVHKTSDRHDSTSGSFHINISYICGVNWNKFHFAHCRYSVQRQQCSKQNVIRSVVKSRPN